MGKRIRLRLPASAVAEIEARAAQRGVTFDQVMLELIERGLLTAEAEELAHMSKN